MTLRLPAEHGAWGILTIPFLCGAAAASNPAPGWPGPLLLAALCVLGVFLLRGSLESYGDWRAIRLPAHLALAGASVASAAALVFWYDRYALIPLGAGALLLYLILRLLVRNHLRDWEKRSLAAELIGVILLTLSAPAASIAVTGQLNPLAARVWLLNVLFFLGGVLYVKYRVRGVLAHRPFAGVPGRFAFAWPVFAYHLLLALFLVSATLLDSLSAAVLLAFAPAILRAHVLLFNLGRRFPIKRLGWTEVAHSLVFAILLILASR